MSKDFKWYLNSAISLSLMLFVRFIPAPEPMTPLGMTVVGIFIGAIYGWCTTNMIGPSIMALILFGLTGYTTPTAAWGALMSNMTVGIAFWLMISVGLLKNIGLLEYIANWSVSRKFTQGKPWLLFVIIYLAAAVCASCLSEVSVTLAFWGLVWAMCDKVGYGKGTKTGAWATFSVALVVAFGGFLLPFKMAVISNFGFLAAGSGGLYDGSYEYGYWTIFTLTVCTVMFAVYLLISKYIIRVDLSKFASYTPDTKQMDKMTGNQKICLTLFVVLFVLLMAPSFMPKAWALTKLLKTVNTTGCAMLIVAITCMIHIDGKPLLKFEDLVSENVIWNVILMFGTALVLCACINNEASGVAAWLKIVLAPVFGGLSPFGFVVCYMLFGILITNFINNAVVGAILIPISYSFSVALGINPIAVCACMILFADFGIMLPSASPTGALLYNSQGWIPKNMLYKNCFLGIALFICAALFIGWPLANVLF